MTNKKSGGKRLPGRPSGSTNINRDVIVEAAIALIDQSGLHALKIRDVANFLGVFPATIQYHIKTKDDLLAAVSHRVMEGINPPTSGLTWQEWITALFMQCRVVFKHHPNIAQLIGAHLVSNSSLRTDLIEGILRTLTQAGFHGVHLRDAYNTVVAAMLGFLTMEFAPYPADDSERWSAELKERVQSIRPLDFPCLTAALPVLANQAFIVRWDNGTVVPLDESFMRYTKTFISGLEVFAQEVAAQSTP
ncbi:MAG: TetR/AcrR family transcriptional regulator [Pigmentiphaga sp.]